MLSGIEGLSFQGFLSAFFRFCNLQLFDSSTSPLGSLCLCVKVSLFFVFKLSTVSCQPLTFIPAEGSAAFCLLPF
jgi:hypothetical protein